MDTVLQCSRCKRTDRVFRFGYFTCETCREKNRIYMTSRREQLVKDGLCYQCYVSPAKEGGGYCQKCLDLQKQRREIRKRNGKCAFCDNDSPNRTVCVNCQNKRNDDSLDKRKHRTAEGKCCCGRERDDLSYLTCSKCRISSKEGYKKRIEGVNKGRCISCSDSRLSYNRRCEVCYLKLLSTKHLGNSSRWGELKLKYDFQQGICPYTGIILVIGNNAALDHIVPKSSGGESVIDNLQWVYDLANVMKWKNSEEIFLQLVKKIYEHRKLEKE
jgi:hypothetical protein